jgi:ABC-2 type transport system permease protein
MFRFIIRISAFIGKELAEILRQTPLILTLVLGPFLILLLFGIGYRSEARPLRTVFVVNGDPGMKQQVEEYARNLGPQLVYKGITSDQDAAIRDLRRGTIDVVVVVPPDAMETIRNNQQAVVTLYHNEIDPYQTSYVEAFGDAYIGAINQRLLHSATEQGQEEASSIQGTVQTARGSVQSLRQAMDQGGITAVQPDKKELVVKMESDLTRLESQLTEFDRMQPNVMISPFKSEVKGLVNIDITPAGFFAPAVVILLLQHLAVTFASLAIVREKNSGTVELFRVSPLGSFEILAGKYISYLIIGGLLAAAITATIILGLKVPMQGAWRDYALVILVLLFTSLGLGFVISLLAQTDMQAVQYAMFVLLGSVFFTGFFLDLRYLWEPIRAISWAIPATYGIRMLQDTALRGAPINARLYFPLLGIGVGLFTISWYLLRRRLQLSV